ncbi:hypothetical protein P152DRAFT_457094 [Eremomyces bilateralis CBS 781.70]|uniref:Transcriptional regulator Ngg1 n=1 Tax=Eremomyces bilateralis CBS 781.70 TaxID=1392243 RepID=A0A6G1G6T6_9PEZI|nr:uncharacterized protein P152DRAFT_457094 [Eremomyces bilateralis CBS 781.70]KAF1813732.1 hypothetical protein P152DRAFT_457094 [Eremomyces bilateralis CBS 781.70]
MAPTSSKTRGKPHPRSSASRNTTPASASAVSVSIDLPPSSSYFQTNLAPSSAPATVEDILDDGGAGQAPPSAAAIHSMQDEVKSKVVSILNARGETCERLIRELSKKRKERIERNREKERLEREAEERKRKQKQTKKREKDDERPPAVGAHGVTRQDGAEMKAMDTSSSISSPASAAPPSVAATAPRAESIASVISSEDSHQPSPAPAVRQYQTFGPDPSTFPDPTVYHIRDVSPGMTEEEQKEIYCVASYPHDDLHDLTPGTPPDRDFSNAKPATQVSAIAFANYVEPYIRPLTEEDLVFLREKQDRVTPFVMPPRGPRHFRDIWADEDGAMDVDSDDEKLPQNEARGSVNNINDEVAQTDQVSAGPVLARLLQSMRAEGRPSETDKETNGDTNIDDIDFDISAQLAAADSGESLTNGAANGTSSTPANPTLPSSTAFAEISTNPSLKSLPPTKQTYTQLDDRALQELRHIGFIGPDDTPSYDSHFDDEVAARLRLLQSELKTQIIMNAARKARLYELAEESMAMQEFGSISDDLDGQLNQAYLKRNRTMGKGKKNVKRPVGAQGAAAAAAAAGVTRPTVGEPIRALMERRAKWNSIIGPVVNFGRTGVPRESVFDEETIRRLVEREKETWGEGGEEGEA